MTCARASCVLLALACEPTDADRTNAAAGSSTTDDGAAVWAGGSTDDGERLDIGAGPLAPQCPFDDDDAFGDVTHTARVPPVVSGGTLLIARDGGVAFAADPDRDVVHVVDLVAREVRGVVELPPESEPGRLVEDEARTVHVVLRNAGAIASIDPDTAQLVATHEVCGNPRGIASDAADGSLLVACMEGVLARVHADGAIETMDLGVELRDVVDAGPPIRVSTLQPPQVLTVALGGDVASAAPPVGLLGSPGGEAPTADAVMNTARRTVGVGDGWVMLHQAAFPGAGITGVPGGWGGHCFPVQSAVVTRFDPSRDGGFSFALPAVGPVFDVAVPSDASGSGQIFAVVGGGAPQWFLGIVDLERLFTVVDSCDFESMIPMPGLPTAVAFDPDGLVWVQIREPARLVAVDPATLQIVAEVPIADDSVLDTGHELFHRVTRSGLACVSCHPDGRQDGVVWVIDAQRRRTQPLNVDLEGTEPLHWRGDLADMHEIFDEVRGVAMCGEALGPEYADALARFVFGLRREIPVPRADAQAIARGGAMFTAIGCATCHAGPHLTHHESVPIAGFGELQIPTLLGVAYRPPYMHDGRAPTLVDAVVAMLPITDPGGPLTDEQTRDLAAYLASL